ASGPFHDHPFLLVDCAAAANGALENQLFGPIKSTNGLGKAKEGSFALASGGTMFFDEIGEMPLDIQGRLVRALQEREFHVQGNGKSIAVDVRIVASTSCDLETAVQQGTFRRDLFFRLNVVGLRLPPLRERKEDIRPLAENFLERVGHARQVQYSIHPDALKLLQMYEWPGNVRELENALERALVLGSTDSILPDDLPEAMLEAGSTTAAPTDKYYGSIKETKKQLILQALQQANGNYIEAAKALGMHPNSLLRLVRNLDLKAVKAGIQGPAE
ncbi:MAG: sigma 54-interacting transcriptional regulator, partial [Candidatus Angelobacter sp.]